MLKNMKALPKAIIIGMLVALPIVAYVKFAPKSDPKVEAPTVVLQQVPVESEAVKRAAERIEAPVQEAPKTSNVTSGDAGMSALLQAGQKK